MEISSDFDTGSHKVPVALHQHPNYGRALSALGVQVHNHRLRCGPGQAARAQIVGRRFGPIRVHWLPRGPVWHPGTPPDIRQGVLSRLLVERSGSGFLLVQAEDAADSALYAGLRCHRLVAPQHVAELDLARPAADRCARQTGKWRNRLRHARRSGLDVGSRPFQSGRDETLIARESIQRRARGYRALPPEFTLAWARRQPQATHLFTACHRGHCVAFVLLLLHPPCATYHLGWTGPEGRRRSAHNLLIWEAAEWLAARGYIRFDLGVVNTDSAPGLARFKIGCGATVRPLGHTMLHFSGVNIRRRRLARRPGPA